jgi:hypothetical protein
MRYFHWFITLVALSILAGCFQVKTVVRVNPDGSGTVEESMMLSRKFISSMEEMMQGLGSGGDAKPETLDLFQPDKLNAEAPAMGEGVTYLSGEKAVTADYTGYVATYAFTDITRLKLNQQSAAAGAGSGTAGSLPITFRFTKGNPATLVVEQPKGKTPAAKGDLTPADTVQPDASAPQTPGQLPDGQAAKMAELFMGMKFELAIDINGTIVSTNATHRKGQRITLVDVDLSKVGDLLPRMEQLNRLNTGSFEESRELLKDLPGIKVEMNDKLTVVFR